MQGDPPALEILLLVPKVTGVDLTRTPTPVLANPQVIHINKDLVEKSIVLKSLVDQYPSPLAVWDPMQDTSEEPGNFPPLSSGYASSEWSDDVIAPTQEPASENIQDQLHLKSTQKTILPRVAI